MSADPVVPFVCERCGAKFQPPEGGICVACGQLLCGRHGLQVPQDRSRTSEETRGARCDTCREL